MYSLCLKMTHICTCYDFEQFIKNEIIENEIEGATITIQCIMCIHNIIHTIEILLLILVYFFFFSDMDMSQKFAVVETFEDQGKGYGKCFTAVPTIWLQKDAYSVRDSDVDLSYGADFMKYPRKTSLRIENCRQKGQPLPVDCEWDGMQCKIKSTWTELRTVSHIMFKYILIYTQTYIFLWRTKNKFMLYVITFLGF